MDIRKQMQMGQGDWKSAAITRKMCKGVPLCQCFTAPC